jgi:hypothetical protein
MINKEEVLRMKPGRKINFFTAQKAKDSEMQKKDKKKIGLLIPVFSFLIIALILLALWNLFLVEEIKRSKVEREELKKSTERIEILEKVNRNFIKDVVRYRAVALCFWELIGEYKNKYKKEETQECIQLIAIIDEKFRCREFDAPLILAWLEKESDGNPEAVSYAKAKGLTQLMDFRADEVLIALGYSGYDEELVFNPVINLTGGVYHFIGLMNYWRRQGIKNKSLILFYALHSYKWGTKNTEELFNTEKRAYRPAIEYVNWILNRKEYWSERLENWMNNSQRFEEEREKPTRLDEVRILESSDE